MPRKERIPVQKTISYEHVQDAITSYCHSMSLINDDETATIGRESGLGDGYFLTIEKVASATQKD